MKILLLMVTYAFFTIPVKVQDTIIIMVNNKIVSEEIIKTDQAEVFLKIKRSDLKKRGPFIIHLSGELISG